MAFRRPITISGFGIRGWRPFALAAGAAVAASAVFTGWTAFHWVSDQATIDLDDIGEAAAAFIAAGSCAPAAARNASRTRVAWPLLAAFPVRWGAGEGGRTLSQGGLGISVPFPLAAG